MASIPRDSRQINNLVVASTPRDSRKIHEIPSCCVRPSPTIKCCHTGLRFLPLATCWSLDTKTSTVHCTIKLTLRVADNLTVRTLITLPQAGLSMPAFNPTFSVGIQELREATPPGIPSCCVRPSPTRPGGRVGGACGDARAGYIHTRYIGAVPKFSKIVFRNDHPSRWDVCSVANDHVRKRRLAGPAREMAKTQMRDRSARLLIFRRTLIN